jgi:hypothetical protein
MEHAKFQVSEHNFGLPSCQSFVPHRLRNIDRPGQFASNVMGDCAHTVFEHDQVWISAMLLASISSIVSRWPKIAGYQIARPTTLMAGKLQ